MTETTAEVRLAVIEEKLTVATDTIKQLKDENAKQNDLIIEQVKLTNGSVASIKSWQIKHEAEIGLLKQGFKFFVIPVFAAIVLGSIGFLVNYFWASVLP